MTIKIIRSGAKDQVRIDKLFHTGSLAGLNHIPPFTKSGQTMKKLLILIFLFISPLLYSASTDSLLKPEEAFQVSIQATDPDSITATWKIADGYYMYRKRFSFKSNKSGVVLGAPEFPEGELQDDPSAGKVVVYRNNVSIKIPIRNNSNISSILLKTKSQGCSSDTGVCYPPQKVGIMVTLPTTPTAAPALSGITGIDETIPSPITGQSNSEGIEGIGGITSDSEATTNNDISKASELAKQLGIPTFDTGKNSNGPLHPDKAFAFDISAIDKQTLNAHWQITPGHYLYQHKIRFKIRNTEGVTLGEWTLPKGIPHNDEYFGDIITYEKDFEVKIPLIGKVDSITIKTGYQGCSTITGICYPPQNKTQTIDLSTAPDVDLNKTNNLTNETGNNKISEQDQFANILKDNSLLTIIGLFFLAGLALTFTPCVFPMIPILSGIISGQGDNISKKKAFFLSLAYVLPMALTYAVVGVLAGLSGESLTAALQTPWIIATFALLFVALAFAMFGFYELQMPASIQNRLASVSNQQKSGSFIGAAIMGMLSALIVGPCVTAPLTGALIFIADTKDAMLGGLSLFMLGMGMGVPLLMIGTAAGEFLPKAGAWMDKVKAVFGVLMLALAIWMLERILPIETIILLTAALLIGSAVYMKAIDTLDAQASGWDRLWKAIGIIILIYGIVLMLGIAKGNNSFFTPLKDNLVTLQNTALTGSTADAPKSDALVFTPIKGINGLNSALEIASAQNKTLMLDFYADWCISCKEMEHKVFTDPRIIKALEGTSLVQADVTKNDEMDIELMKKFGLFGPPGILFFDTKKQEYRSFRVVGEMTANNFLAHVTEFLNQKNK